MNTITMFLPLLMILLIIGVVAFLVIKLGKNEPDYSLRSSSRGESILLTLLGFFFPVIGLILFLVWRNTRPELATPIATGVKIYLGLIILMILPGIVIALLP